MRVIFTGAHSGEFPVITMETSCDIGRTGQDRLNVDNGHLHRNIFYISTVRSSILLAVDDLSFYVRNVFDTRPINDFGKLSFFRSLWLSG